MTMKNGPLRTRVMALENEVLLVDHKGGPDDDDDDDDDDGSSVLHDGESNGSGTTSNDDVDEDALESITEDHTNLTTDHHHKMIIKKRLSAPQSGSFSGGGTNNNDATGSTPPTSEVTTAHDILIDQEDRGGTAIVRRWRCIVISILLALGIGVTVGTNYMLARFRSRINEEKLQHLGQDITSVMMERVSNLQENVRSVADMMATTVAAQDDPTGLFLTTSRSSSSAVSTTQFFDRMADRIRNHSLVQTLAFSPLLWTTTPDKILQWLQLQPPPMDHDNIVVVLGGSSNNNNNTTDTTVVQAVLPLFSEYQSPRPPVTNTTTPSSTLLNLADLAVFQQALVQFQGRSSTTTTTTPAGVFSPLLYYSNDNKKDDDTTEKLAETLFQQDDSMLKDASLQQQPFSLYLEPVYIRNREEDDTTQKNETSNTLVGVVFATIRWGDVLDGLLDDESIFGIYAVLTDRCGNDATFKFSGPMANYVGNGDMHLPITYDDTLANFLLSNTETSNGFCKYSFSFHTYKAYIVQSQDYKSLSDKVMILVGLMVLLTFGVVCVYDFLLRQRHMAILHAAARSNAIISSLFPTNFRDRLFEEAEADAETTQESKFKKTGDKTDTDALPVEGAANDDPVAYKGKPIADLFAETTILFADISGFTAWSSVREPPQVFILLETLYHAFDGIAKQRGVFKVETVGDCYVAVTGLPEPRVDHAIAMCRFAHECMQRTRVLTKRLEVLLGPDTAELAMRMGIHSGPVTAGILRGERSRFQLFGDTMNTAARMEHTGIRDKIQLSQETADILIKSGKMNWVKRREDLVFAKGKGEMQTYFLEITAHSLPTNLEGTSNAGSSQEESTTRSEQVDTALDSKTKRLVGWNVDVLLRLLKQIEAKRRACVTHTVVDSKRPDEAQFHASNRQKYGVLDEIKEIIALPKFQEVDSQEDVDLLTLRPEVASELHNYVSNIALMYRPNDFHNFEHASHVTMSVVKLLSRIVAPQECADGDLSSLHDHTYGITSDPLTQFACVLSALIHDTDHAGVSNVQLVKEMDEVATRYNNKSVLEQNSLDLAWDLLMNDEYKNLRRTIYQTDAELVRFRQLLVNSVMATDISDKELKTLRNLRWERAFAAVTDSTLLLNDRDTINRKATIVIEHLIQASDVAHTMQHWHVYRKWNERFFMECYQAYKDGRAETDPSLGWYTEYLNYAMQNRQEWEARGKEVVDEMLQKVK